MCVALLPTISSHSSAVSTNSRIKKKLVGKRRSELYLLKRECAVRSTPLMMWKSPLLKRVTISVSRSGHFWGKSSLPMILMASLNCWKSQRWAWSNSFCTSSNQTEWPWHVTMYLFLDLFWAAQHQIYNVCLNCCSVRIRHFVWFIFNLQETKHRF